MPLVDSDAEQGSGGKATEQVFSLKHMANMVRVKVVSADRSLDDLLANEIVVAHVEQLATTTAAAAKGHHVRKTDDFSVYRQFMKAACSASTGDLLKYYSVHERGWLIYSHLACLCTLV